MAYSIVSHWVQGSTDTNGFTSSAHDTSGGDEIIVAITDFDGTSTLSDSKSNTWVASYTTDTIRTPATQIWNAKNATCGTGHTFTVTASGKSPAIYVIVLSGSDTTAGVDQAANHFIDFASSGQPGSITPSVDNEILISVCDHQDFGGSNVPTIDSGFTVLDTLLGVGGQHWGGGVAYLIETTATAKNPTWTMATSSLTSAGIASFKAASGGGGGGGIVYPSLERVLRGARRGILLGAH